MKVAILSDTHSHHANVRAALDAAAQRGAEVILHCGDIADAETVRLFPAHTHFVFGNCDYERAAIEQAVAEIGATLHQPFGQVVLEGRAIAFVHGDHRDVLRALERAGSYDYLFYGHTHQAEGHRTGKTRVINPGALYRAAVKTFAVLDLASGELETVAVG